MSEGPWLHATPKTNCLSIETHGLRPSRNQPVHLSLDDETDIVAFCHTDDEPGDVALYEVDVRGLEVKPGWDTPERMLAVHAVVPPERLHRIR